MAVFLNRPRFAGQRNDISGNMNINIAAKKIATIVIILSPILYPGFFGGVLEEAVGFCMQYMGVA